MFKQRYKFRLILTYWPQLISLLNLVHPKDIVEVSAIETWLINITSNRFGQR